MCEYIKQYLIDNKGTFGKWELEMSDLKRFNPLYWKMEKGKVVEDKGPTLYAKCLYDRKNDKINTVFVNDETKEIINPQSIIGQRCYVSFALKVEGIFIGNKISLQVKLSEVLFRLKETGIKSLLCPEATLANEIAGEDSSDEEVEEEEDGEDEEEEEVEEEEKVVEKIELKVQPELATEVPKKRTRRQKVA